MPKTTWCPRTHRGVRAKRQRLVRHAQDHLVPVHAPRGPRQTSTTSAPAPPAWAPCPSPPCGSVRHRVQVLQLRQRGLRVRAPPAAARGTVCKCFSSPSVGIVIAAPAPKSAARPRDCQSLRPGLATAEASGQAAPVSKSAARPGLATVEASGQTLPAWAPCASASSGSARHRVQVLQLCQRGHRVRAPLAAACGTVCKCFSSASVGTVFEHL